MFFQEKNHILTDLDLVLYSFERRVLAERLAHNAWRSEVPVSSHDD